MWIMTEAQFDNFKIGGFTASELNSASIGALSTNVIARASETASITGKGFAEDDGLQLNLTAGSSANDFYRMDEIRWGQSLDDVLPLIPEPSAGSLGLLAFGLLTRPLRRR